MAARIRIYEKKRGHRRTGSAKAGSAGEAIFFTTFFLLGCIGLAGLVASFVIPEWRATNQFVPHTCTVLDARVGQIQREGRPFYRPEIQVKYAIEGETYVAWTYDVHSVRGNGYSADRSDAEAVLNRYQAGREYRCWYDPTDRTTAVLVRGLQWWVWLTFAVPASLVMIGGGGLAYSVFSWGKSDERRCALVRKAASLAAFEPTDGGQDYPNVPSIAEVVDSPGTTLRYRLPMAVSPLWALGAALAACLFWNGIVAVFVAFEVSSHLSGNPNWFLTLLLVPFVLVGVALVLFFFRQLLVTTGIGPTIIEVSDHPLYPGGQYRLFLSQTGRLRFNALEMTLVCEEEATFRHGTDTRTETRRVFERSLFRREGFEVHRGFPYESLCTLDIPLDAMHSFKSQHNEVNWKVIVRGNVARWPDYERSFPIIVYPASEREHR